MRIRDRYQRSQPPLLRTLLATTASPDREPSSETLIRRVSTAPGRSSCASVISAIRFAGVCDGAPAAWATGLGCCAGIALWGVTSVAGVAALLAASGRAFDVLRIPGAVYLALLGASALRSALSRGATPVAGLLPGAARDAGAPTTAAAPALERRTAFRQGLVSNLLNPKIALLFLTLLPQFVAPGEPRTETTAELGLAFLLVGLVWMRLLSLGVGAGIHGGRASQAWFVLTSLLGYRCASLRHGSHDTIHVLRI